MSRGRRRILVGCCAALALVGFWTFSTSFSSFISHGRFPSPPQVWEAARQIGGDGYADANLWQHALHSLRLVILGFLVAVAIGAPLGILMGASRRFDAFITPVFSLIRPIPPLAWIPLAILWLGLGDGAKIMVIFFAAFVPSVINSHAGVRAIEPHFLEASQVLGARGFTHIREVLVPGAMPMIFTGLRLSLQASWTTLVAAELVGALAGLGRVLNVAQQDIYPAMILVAMAAVALLGWATTRLLDVIESRAMPWLPARA
ncbi:MAG TPA: ABC transporter permease [Beijerinckiaceae bacterium]|nr:ABC transporter permease [Beijerinckiaceae bacterium]